MNQSSESLFQWMCACVQKYGQAPTVAEIRKACDFAQAGGIGRLCATLETFGVLMAKSAKGRAA